jgi:hypothetical protein
VQAILDRIARRLLAERIEALKTPEQPQEAISPDVASRPDDRAT